MRSISLTFEGDWYSKKQVDKRELQLTAANQEAAGIALHFQNRKELLLSHKEQQDRLAAAREALAREASQRRRCAGGVWVSASRRERRRSRHAFQRTAQGEEAVGHLWLGRSDRP